MIGEAFRIRRKRRGLTQEQTARLVRTSPSYVAKYETNLLCCTKNDLLKRLDALNKAWTLEDMG